MLNFNIKNPLLVASGLLLLNSFAYGTDYKNGFDESKELEKMVKRFAQRHGYPSQHSLNTEFETSQKEGRDETMVPDKNTVPENSHKDIDYYNT
jgi:hypothetical protein